MRFVLELWPDEGGGHLTPAQLVKEAIDSVRDHGEQLAWDVQTDAGELIAEVTPDDLARLEANEANLPPIVFADESHDSWMQALQHASLGQWCLQLTLADGTTRDVFIDDVGFVGTPGILSLTVVGWREDGQPRDSDPREVIQVSQISRIRVY